MARLGSRRTPIRIESNKRRVQWYKTVIRRIIGVYRVAQCRDKSHATGMEYRVPGREWFQKVDLYQ